MGVLQDFERRLEGAVEGFFARAFRSGLQPIELAKAIQRYAEDNQHVTESGVLVPNVYRFRVSERDRERLASYGDSLPRELAEVVVRTAEERDWTLRGPVLVRIERTDEVPYGRYRLAGRVEEVEEELDEPDSATVAPPSDAPSAPPPPPPAEPERAPALEVLHGADRDQPVPLRGTRMTAGRLASCDLVLSDQTVSREHAAFVRRGEEWWVVDLDSTNGTRVNGTSTGEHRIDVGDRIELGEAVLEVVDR